MPKAFDLLIRYGSPFFLTHTILLIFHTLIHVALLISNTLSKLNFYHFHVYRSCIVYCFALLVLIFFMYFRLVISHLPNLVVMRACSTVTYVMCFFLVLVENGGQIRYLHYVQVQVPFPYKRRTRRNMMFITHGTVKVKRMSTIVLRKLSMLF